MDLYVIIGKRKESYPGEYGIEALGSMTEYDADANFEWLESEAKKHRSTGEFYKVEVIKLEVSEKAIMDIINPHNKPIPAAIVTGE